LIHSLHISIKGNDYGIGHSVRQKNLSDYAHGLGWICEAVSLNQTESLEIALSKTTCNIAEIDVVFLDLDPRYITLNRSSILKVLKLFKLNDCKIALFDIDLDFSLNQVLDNFDFDFVFCPYVNLGVNRYKKKYSGFGLSIFSADLERVRNDRKQKDVELSDVLISCGGSDPLGISLIYLDVLEEVLPPNSPIKVIVGGEFAKTLVDDIFNFSHSSRLNLHIIESPGSISEHLKESKFILTTGGLTRTESIYVGVPPLVVDIDQGQFKSTKLFVDLGAAFSLGLASPENILCIKTNLRELLAEIQTNLEILPIMSDRARLSIDSNGAFFILKEIENYVYE
jgi:spore coat polysaccharide biosynthesis predicted glycosyltransferase SpsG